MQYLNDSSSAFVKGDTNSKIFVGYLAGGSSTGNYNSFLGYMAGNVTTGNSNVFLGYKAGILNANAVNNIFVGDNTGAHNTTGSNNCFIGYRAGFNNVSGSGNVFVGYKAGYNETASNRLYIANSDTSTLIYGEFDNKRVGILDNTSPTAALDINSDILRLRTSKTPATAGASGNTGDICWDSDYIYVCVATNTWKRVGISTW